MCVAVPAIPLIALAMDDLVRAELLRVVESMIKQD